MYCEGLEELRVAILRQAAQDYERALKDNAAREIKSLELFFTSEWGEFLSANNGTIIISNCRKRVNDGRYIISTFKKRLTAR